MRAEIQKLTDNILKGDKRAVARAISMVESGEDGYQYLLNGLYFHKKNALRVGITGPPGAGKSTFTNQLIKRMRAADIWSGGRVPVGDGRRDRRGGAPPVRPAGHVGYRRRGHVSGN